MDVDRKIVPERQCGHCKCSLAIAGVSELPVC